jgi:hypothetical protein
LGFELRRLQEHRWRQSRQLAPIPLNLAPDQVEELVDPQLLDLAGQCMSVLESVDAQQTGIAATIGPIDIDGMRVVIKNCHSVGSPMAT